MPHSQPKPRADLHVRKVGEQIVIVCERTGKAHMLDGDQVVVWEALSAGERPAVSDEVAAAVIAELAELDLLEFPAGLDRRQLLQRSAVVGGVGIATLALGELPAYASSNVPTTLTLGSGNTNPAPGSTVTFTGTLKRASGSQEGVEGVTINFTNAAGTSIGTAVTTTGGAYSKTLTMPATGQQYVVKATSVADTTYSASNTAQVTEYVTSLTATPNTGTKGRANSITLTGAGFAAGTVTFTLVASGGSGDTISPTTTTASSTGSFTVATTLTAANANHSTTITATDSLGNKATTIVSF